MARINRKDVPMEETVGVTIGKTPIFPYVSDELVSHLEKMFPVKVSKDIDIREVDNIIGTRMVVEYLIELNKQNKQRR